MSVELVHQSPHCHKWKLAFHAPRPARREMRLPSRTPTQIKKTGKLVIWHFTASLGVRTGRLEAKTEALDNDETKAGNGRNGKSCAQVEKRVKKESDGFREKRVYFSARPAFGNYWQKCRHENDLESGRF